MDTDKKAIRDHVMFVTARLAERLSGPDWLTPETEKEVALIDSFLIKNLGLDPSIEGDFWDKLPSGQFD